MLVSTRKVGGPAGCFWNDDDDDDVAAADCIDCVESALVLQQERRISMDKQRMDLLLQQLLLLVVVIEVEDLFATNDASCPTRSNIMMSVKMELLNLICLLLLFVFEALKTGTGN